ncbi:MAG TPA: hypothetical protein PKH93_02210 [Chitinophagales bacterium]|nr:hypothetical protein [Chitinophagales bacterium]
MKQQYKHIIAFFLIAILCSAITNEKLFEEYVGGRFGFSGITIKLYNDSTYYCSEWNHTGRSIKDNGKWGKIDNHYYLNSISKTRWTGRGGKSKRLYRFDVQEFIIHGDTLKFIPKNAEDIRYNAEDIRYYDLYYKLYKVTKTAE